MFEGKDAWDTAACPSVVVLLKKHKGYKADLDSHRGISLLPVCSRIARCKPARTTAC